MLRLKVFIYSENKKQYSSIIKKMSLFGIMFLFFVSMASATNYAEALGWWSNPGSTEGRTSVCSAQSGAGTWDFTSEKSTGTSSSYGSAFQPIIADMNSDNITDIILSDSTSNYLMAMKYSGGSLVFQAQQTEGNDQTQNAALFFDHLLNKWSIAIPTATKIKVYTFNGSRFNNTFNASTHTPTTPIICSSTFNSDTYGNICFWGASQVAGDYYEMWSKDHSVHNKTVTSACTGTVPYADIAFSNNFNGNTVALSCKDQHKIIYVTAISMENKTITTGTYNPSRLLFYNSDGSGQDELFSILQRDGSSPIIYKYDSSGALKHSVIPGNYGTGCVNLNAPADFAAGIFANYSWPRQIFYASFSDDADCFYVFGAETLNWIRQYHEYPLTTSYLNLVAADLDNDGFKDIITTKGIIFPEHSEDSFNFSIDHQGSIVAGDITGDGFKDFVGTYNSLETWFVSGTPTSFDITLNGRGLDRSYSNPVCTNSSVCFYAKDAVAYPYYEANYISGNNNTQEYLFTGCGKTQLWLGSTGNPSANYPFICCYYGINETLANSMRSFKVYITDTITGTQLTGLDSSDAKYWDVQVNLLNEKSSDGNCNQAVEIGTTVVYTTPEAVAGSTEAQVKGLFDSLTYGSAFVKTVLVFLLFLGVIVFLAMYAHVSNPIIYIIVSIVMLCLCAVVGLISWAYIILIGFLIALVAGIAWFSGGLGSSNGGP